MNLKIQNVSFSINGRSIVNDVSITVNPGEVVGLMGPNGAGKTTTFNLAVGNIKPDKGKVSMNGKNITEFPLPIRSRLGLGYLTQEASIFRDLTVKDNIDLALQNLSYSRAAIRNRREQLINEFNLNNFSLPDFLFAMRTVKLTNNCLKPIPIIKDTISMLLEKGVYIYILTNGFVEQQRNKFKSLDLPDKNKINIIYASSNNRVHEKPNPFFINKIKTEHYLSNNQIIFIGDSIIDEETAKNACIDFLNCSKINSKI